jgi:hypothetical protein
MNILAALVLVVLGSALAIPIGCWGVELIDENPIGWVLLAVGIDYPPGAVFYVRQHLKHS